MDLAFVGVQEMQVSDHDQVWMAVAQQLRDQLTEVVWYSTFQDVVPLAANGEHFQISVPSNHVRDRILHPLPAARAPAHSTRSSRRVVELDIVVAPSASTDLSDDLLARAAPTLLDRGLGYDPDGTALLDEAGLNPRYTFETFVKGASNQFALAAALRVAETPARSYNPLFIYGAAGLGKTHLLHAIGHYVHHNYQHHGVRYVSTETFLNEFVDAIRTNTTTAFKRRYRDIDVLLIDDIQFLEKARRACRRSSSTPSTRCTGRTSRSSSRPTACPDAIPTLEERLRGRFKWGLITDIQPPDLETRLAILRNKAERDHGRGAGRDARVHRHEASPPTSASSRVRSSGSPRTPASTKCRITTELAQHLLADLLREATPKPRTDERDARGDRGHPRLRASTR